MNNIRAFIGRGALAGLVGGLSTAVFQFFVTEDQIRAALAIETATAVEPAEEMFSRGTQVVGGLVAAGLYGVFLGVVFGIVCAALWPILPGRGVFGRSIRLSGAAFVGWVLVPALKYPPNPPGVGDPDTIGGRTGGYVALLVVSLIVLYLALDLWNRLTAAGRVGGTRFAIVAAGYLAVITILYLVFPASPDPVELPANLIWHFRLDSLAGNALLWLVLGVVFGLLGDRRSRSAATTDAQSDGVGV